MTPPRVLVLVLAGGAGSRLELLTEWRAKPAVPFAGVYRLADFALSNCQHSGLADVWVSVQHHPASLSEHLAGGRPWDLDRTTGGLMVLPPHLGTERAGFHTGTADSLWKYAPLVRAHGADALVVLSSDAVYKLDYREVVEAHLGSGKDLTMVTADVPEDDASRYGVVQVDGDQVTGYAYKPERPAGRTVATEVFVLSPRPVLDRLEQLARAAERDGGELEDLGDQLLPDLARDGAAGAHPVSGYWRDVGTVDAYWAAHQDFLSSEPPLQLDEPGWPVHTREGADSAARVLAGAAVERSLLSSGSVVAGTVRGSVLSPGVHVEAGATVEDSVLLPGVVVRAGATVRRAVVDDAAVLGEGASVGGSSGVALVGHGARVDADAPVPAGGRHPAPEG